MGSCAQLTPLHAQGAREGGALGGDDNIFLADRYGDGLIVFFHHKFLNGNRFGGLIKILATEDIGNSFHRVVSIAENRGLAFQTAIA